jgi:hypothetical protein
MNVVLVYAIASAAVLLTGYRDPQALQPLTKRIGHATILVEQKKVSVVRVPAGHVFVGGQTRPQAVLRSTFAAQTGRLFLLPRRQMRRVTFRWEGR